MFNFCVYTPSKTQRMHLLQNAVSDMYKGRDQERLRWQVCQSERDGREKHSIVKVGNQLSTNSGFSLGTTRRPA